MAIAAACFGGRYRVVLLAVGFGIRSAVGSDAICWQRYDGGAKGLASGIGKHCAHADTRELSTLGRTPSFPVQTRTAESSFAEAVEICERQSSTSKLWHPSMPRVPELLRHAFDLDVQPREERDGSTRVENVSCLRPAGASLSDEGVPYGYHVRGEALLQLETEPGRACLGGSCSQACSRVQRAGFATADECDALRREATVLLPAAQDGEDLVHLIDFVCGGNARGALLMARIVERTRRAIAREYGLPLRSLVPDATFVSRISAAPSGANQASAAAEDGYAALHSDESSIGVHYSAVLYLSTQGRDFDGGDFVWRYGGSAVGSAHSACETRVPPRSGHGIFFSSGWENTHYVDTVVAGTRFAVSMFYRSVGCTA